MIFESYFHLPFSVTETGHISKSDATVTALKERGNSASQRLVNENLAEIYQGNYLLPHSDGSKGRRHHINQRGNGDTWSGMKQNKKEGKERERDSV